MSAQRGAAIALVADAIQAGIFNDLGSGSNVDVVVVTRAGAEILRNHLTPNERPPKEQRYIYAPGTTPVLYETIRPLSDLVVVEDVAAAAAAAMDIS